jgi:hypothetical protein
VGKLVYYGCEARKYQLQQAKKAAGTTEHTQVALEP